MTGPDSAHARPAAVAGQEKWSDAPAVTAVIPVHNGEAYVGAAIESVLCQTLPVSGCIVVDDGSTDGTAEIVRGYGEQVTYMWQAQSGVSAARNHGMRCAQSEFVGFLDHDDVWLPGKLARQVELLLRPENKAVVMALCAVYVVDEGGKTIGVRRLRTAHDLVQGMLLFDGTEVVSCASTGLVRRQSLLAAGGFDEALSTSADWDLLLRLLLDGAVRYEDEPLALYRVHGTNMSRNVSATEKDAKYAFAKAFANPRLPPGVRERKRSAYSRLYRMLAGSYLEAGAWPDGLRTLALAIWKDPTIARSLIDRGPLRLILLRLRGLLDRAPGNGTS